MPQPVVTHTHACKAWRGRAQARCWCGTQTAVGKFTEASEQDQQPWPVTGQTATMSMS